MALPFIMFHLSFLALFLRRAFAEILSIWGVPRVEVGAQEGWAGTSPHRKTDRQTDRQMLGDGCMYTGEREGGPFVPLFPC